MCRQCLADSVMIKENIVPEWYLVKAQRSIKGWKAGEYALVYMNDPDFVFSGITGFTCDKDNLTDYYQFIDSIEDCLYSLPIVGYRLISAAIEAGYNRKEHGRFACWLAEKIDECIEEYDNE